MAFDPRDEEQEAKDWWEEHGDEVDPVIEDEIDGKEVVSIYDLDEDEQPTTEDEHDFDDEDDEEEND